MRERAKGLSHALSSLNARFSTIPWRKRGDNAQSKVTLLAYLMGLAFLDKVASVIRDTEELLVQDTHTI